MKVMILEDEHHSRVLLSAYISRIPYLELAAVCRSPLEATRILQHEKIDLLLLDIDLPDMSGIDLIKSLPRRPLAVFTTAHSEYALAGYPLDIVDFLLKPFPFERFLQAVNKASRRLLLEQANRQSGRVAPAAISPPPTKDYILVRSEHKIYRIRYREIQYIQGMKEYVAFMVTGQRILSLQSLKSLTEALPADRFLRIHKSYIVPLDRIKAVEGNYVFVGNQKLPIGGSYRDLVLQRVF